MRAKKLGSMVLAAMLALSMAGCGGSGDSTTAAAGTTAAPAATTAAGANTEATAAAETGAAATTAAGTSAEIFSQADAPTFTIVLAHGTAEGQRGDLDCKEFKELVEERSQGKITVQVYPNGQLGTDRELFESTQQGNIQICWQTNAPHVGFVPEIAILDQPMVFDSLDIAWKALESGTELRTALDAAYNKANVELLNIFPYTYRTMTSNREIHSVADFKGLNLRTMDNQYHMAFWSAVGCNPTPLAWGETYIALQQGLMDAQENPIDNILSNKIAEVQDYVIRTDHVLFPSCFIMNKAFYDSMPAEYQQLLKSVLAEIAKSTFDGREASENEQLETCKSEYGMQVIELDASVRAEMKKLAEPVWEQIYTAVGEEMATAFKNTLNSVQ